MKTIITFLLLFFAAISSFAQTTLTGKVADTKGGVISFVTVALLQNGVAKIGVATDANGVYLITGIDPGTYDVEVSEIAYEKKLIQGVIVVANQQNVLNIQLTASSASLQGVLVLAENSKKTKAKKNKTAPKELTIRGSRSNEPTKAYADGVRTPQSSPPLSPAPPPSKKVFFAAPVVKADIQVKTSPPKIEDFKQKEQVLQKLEDKMVVAETQKNATTGKETDADGVPDDEGSNTNDFNALIENIFKEVKNEPVTTFSADVDRASYTTTRSELMNGTLPNRNSIRIEEFINYFNYDYPQPKGNDPIAISTEITNAPWNANTKLVRIGLQAVTIPISQLPPSNLVFLIDVSGSMSAANKLPLMQTALGLLVDKLRPEDKVTLVVYAGAAGTVLPPTAGNQKDVIKEALNNLHAGGSTAGGAGINLAYNEALKSFVKGGNNRVILCTDGDFNVGASSDAALQTLIEEKRKTGVFLSCLGFGMGNYKDNKMETLADKGNGNYAYIDNLLEAKKVFINEFGGTLFTVAKDVKLQIEFNPNAVKAYRLIGYENRALRNEDFNDDKKDAGDMGSGHTVTAFYEVLPATNKEPESVKLADVDPLKYQTHAPSAAANSNELLTVKIRYKQPNGDKSKKIEQVLENTSVDFDKASENFRFAAAVAEFGLLLRKSAFKAAASYEQVTSLATAALGKDPEGYRAEFLQLVKAATLIDK